MFERAKVDLVGSLHLIGRRLAVLKRLYQSYAMIIDRILERQRGLRDEARMHAEASSSFPNSLPHGAGNSQDASVRIMQQPSNLAMTAAGETALGVRLSPSAILRFERLVDRIRLYALSEIEECLSEKESLVFLVCVRPRSTAFTDESRTSTSSL